MPCCSVCGSQHMVSVYWLCPMAKSHGVVFLCFGVPVSSSKARQSCGTQKDTGRGVPGLGARLTEDSRAGQEY